MLNHKKKAGSFYKYIVLFFILLFAVACSEDNNPVDSGMNSSGTSKISGRVDGNQGFSKISSVQGVEGAAVTVARVKADGSLETVSNASVQTDAEGKFTVETDVENEDHLVVVATKGSSEWKAVVSAEVKHNTTVYCPPMSDETTAEAEVYAEAKVEGKTNIVFYSEIQTYVDSDVAAEMKSDANLKTQIVAALEAE
jgi:hypothetical protein